MGPRWLSVFHIHLLLKHLNKITALGIPGTTTITIFCLVPCSVSFLINCLKTRYTLLSKCNISNFSNIVFTGPSVDVWLCKTSTEQWTAVDWSETSHRNVANECFFSQRWVIMSSLIDKFFLRPCTPKIYGNLSFYSPK